MVYVTHLVSREEGGPVLRLCQGADLFVFQFQPVVQVAEPELLSERPSAAFLDQALHHSAQCCITHHSVGILDPNSLPSLGVVLLRHGVGMRAGPGEGQIRPQRLVVQASSFELVLLRSEVCCQWGLIGCHSRQLTKHSGVSCTFMRTATPALLPCTLEIIRYCYLTAMLNSPIPLDAVCTIHVSVRVSLRAKTTIKTPTNWIDCT